MTKPTEEQVKDILAMTTEIYDDMTNALLSSSKKASALVLICTRPRPRKKRQTSRYPST